ncbi:MAG TPA: hypothetical protein VHG32_23995 [Thermoanaerobaculia bacterium]|jgi:hypothetical protein|nr:hypothetical protein [Thermoanaerobaculia bacterium]
MRAALSIWVGHLFSFSLLFSAIAGAEDLDSLLSKSQLVFTGTVQRVGAATEPRFPVDERTAVVQVNKLHRAPAEFQALEGQQVTVELLPGLLPKRGDVAVFFTHSWLFGKSVAVVEVGRLGAGEAESLPARIREADARALEAQLRQRVARAQLIVLGTVTETRSASGGSGTATRPLTEHDPDWWEATIRIASVVKGNRPPDLRVLFPMSTDVLWLKSPKLHSGTTVLLLLQNDQQERGMPVLRRPGWTALDVLDVLVPDQLEHIRTLIGAASR